jgi:hypothetical protein
MHIARMRRSIIKQDMAEIPLKTHSAAAGGWTTASIAGDK